MHTVGKGIKMFFLLVKVSFAYPLPVSYNRCAFLFYLQKVIFVQCYSVLSEFNPMANGDYVT